MSKTCHLLVYVVLSNKVSLKKAVPHSIPSVPGCACKRLAHLNWNREIIDYTGKETQQNSFSHTCKGRGSCCLPLFKSEQLLVLSVCLLRVSSYTFACKHIRRQKMKKVKDSEPFSEVEHKHVRSVTSFDYVHVHKSIIYVTKGLWKSAHQ